MLKKIGQFAGLAAGIFLLTLLIVQWGLFSGVQKRFQNAFYDLDAASPEIVIVAIDERSLEPANLGPLQQWPRANYARALDALFEAGATAVGIDVLFPDHSAKGPEDDRAFSEALASHANTVLAMRFDFRDGGTRFVEEPNDVILESNPRRGWINVDQDEDGFVRRIPLFAPTKTEIREAFPLQLARLYLEEEPVDYRVINGRFQFSDGISIPARLERDARSKQDLPFMLVNYFARPKSYQTLSFSNLLSGNLTDYNGKPVDFKSKIVLIGPTAKGLGDQYISPVSEGVQMAGVEIHANAIQTVIQQKFLEDQSPLSLWIELALIILFNTALFAGLRVRFALPIALAQMAAVLLAGILTYDSGVILNVIYPILAVLFSFVGTFLLRFIIAQKERKFLEGAFTHYVSKDVVNQIIKDPRMLELGGSKREVTVFFSDIENSTTLAESMEPTAWVKILNEYLKAMTDIIIEEQGTLDKYEGDAIVAFWGAPVAHPDDPLRACRAALKNQQKLTELSARWVKEGKPEIRARIGLHTGPAIVGNMGSETRFDYTVMGDTPNLGSRLEGVNKRYGTRIMISESTARAVQGRFLTREIDRIRVKGKHEAVGIHELLAVIEEKTPALERKTAAFGAALALYRQGQFEKALQAFRDMKDDPVAAIFAARCETFLKNPPAPDWDGVFNFSEK